MQYLNTNLGNRDMFGYTLLDDAETVTSKFGWYCGIELQKNGN